MSSRRLIFHPLIVLLVSLMSACLYTLYVTLRFSGDKLSSQYVYVVPIIIPFVAFLFDRAQSFPQLKLIQLAIDALVIGTAILRVVGNVPFISGHALFLTYALLSARSRLAQITAAIVMLEVIYLKYVVWHDWITLTGGIALGSVAALVTWQFRSRANVEGRIPEPTH